MMPASVASTRAPNRKGLSPTSLCVRRGCRHEPWRTRSSAESRSGAKCVRDPTGWRSQYAHPQRLYLPRCYNPNPEATAERLAALCDVPAEVVPALSPVFSEVPA